MQALTLQAAVERNPALYDALRERDSRANRVCELMRHGQATKQATKQWEAACVAVKREYARALTICPKCGNEPMDGRDGFHSCAERLQASELVDALKC